MDSGYKNPRIDPHLSELCALNVDTVSDANIKAIDSHFAKVIFSQVSMEV